MIMRVMFVTVYILSCIRILAAPWRYFQLNAKYFSEKKGIFSKIDIDALIPHRWRLYQAYDDGHSVPEKFPVFVKPEWGQNAFGIWRADNVEDLSRIRKKIAKSKTAYIIQQAASESREFEIFTIPHHLDSSKYAVLTVTEAVNTEGEKYPINSINNKYTSFHELTHKFDQHQLDQIWSYIREFGDFKISRVCVHANSEQDLIDGKFHLIEINLFVPMPINLLDESYGFRDKANFILTSMMALAQVTKTLSLQSRQQPIFTKKLLYQRKARSLQLSHSTTREIL